jgi:hypothetical protein
LSSRLQDPMSSLSRGRPQTCSLRMTRSNSYIASPLLNPSWL